MCPMMQKSDLCNYITFFHIIHFHKFSWLLYTYFSYLLTWAYKRHMDYGHLSQHSWVLTSSFRRDGRILHSVDVSHEVWTYNKKYIFVKYPKISNQNIIGSPRNWWGWGVYGVNFHPNQSIKFSQKWPRKSVYIWKFHKFFPKRVAQNEKLIPNKSTFDIWIPNQRVPEVKKRGSKGRHIPTDSDRSALQGAKGEHVVSEASLAGVTFRGNWSNFSSTPIWLGYPQLGCYQCHPSPLF